MMEHAHSFEHTDGVVITLENVGYFVQDRRPGDNKGKPLYLLEDVTGFFMPGQMSALMGPSGSGKTTLLDVLAGRKTEGTLQGTVMFSGFTPTPEYLRRYTGYVEQFDTLLDFLTPYEMLMYTAELKRKVSEPISSKKAAVNELMKLLALDSCRNVPIGNPLARGISGGQAKRVNIGIALITQPRVIFLDEPTTGLDSYTANEVMTVVKGLAATGVTIVCTIHSPTSYCFSLFDDMMQLVSGRVVYFGPQGQAALTFFQESCPNVKPHSKEYNDAEYLVDLITEADRLGKGGLFADAYAASSLASHAQDRVKELEHSKDRHLSDDLKKELQVKRATETPMWFALWIFIKYRTRRNYTNPAWVAPRVFDKTIISVLVLTLYLGIGNDFSSDNIINMAAVLFMWAATTGFSAASYIPALFLERGTFVRERADGLYLTVTYLTARMFDEVIIAFIVCMVIGSASFYAVRLQGDVMLFCVSWYVGICAGISAAFFVASFAPTLDAANAILPVYGCTLLFFSGFLIRLTDIPPWWKWYSYLCFSRFAWSANMINQFENNDVLWLNDQTVLDYYGITSGTKWGYVGYTAIFYIVFFWCTWAVLNFKKYSSR